LGRGKELLLLLRGGHLPTNFIRLNGGKIIFFHEGRVSRIERRMTWERKKRRAVNSSETTSTVILPSRRNPSGEEKIKQQHRRRE